MPGQIMVRSRPTIQAYGRGNPIFIPHRTDGFIYPEYTMPSFEAAFAGGLRLFELDCQKLSDGAMAIIHDTTVDATTTSTGNVASFDTAGFKALLADVATWHGVNWGNALPPPLLSEFLARFGGKVAMFIEPKSSVGGGAAVVAAMQAAGVGTDQALVNSFGMTDLTPAQAAGYPVSFNSSAGSTADLNACVAAGVRSVGLDINLGDTVLLQWINAGFDVLITGASRRWQRDYYTTLGVAGFYTEDSVYTAGRLPIATRDSFALQNWMHGMLPSIGVYGLAAVARGRFMLPDYWGFSDTGTAFVLQGWACPIKGLPAANSYSIDFKVKYVSATDTARWAGLLIADSTMGDRAFTSSGSLEDGYQLLMRKSGQLQIFKKSGASSTQIATASAAAIADGEEVAFRAVVTPTTVALLRLNSDGSTNTTCSATDATYRGGYFHLGHNGLACYFRAISIS